LPPPAPARDDGEDATELQVFVEKAGQLAQGKSRADGDLYRTVVDLAGDGRVGQVPFGTGSSDGIRPVEDDDGDVRLGRSLHGMGHSVRIGPVAAPDVDEVDDENVDLRHSLGRRLPAGTVQAVDGQPGLGIRRVGDGGPGLGFAPYAVLR